MEEVIDIEYAGFHREAAIEEAMRRAKDMPSNQTIRVVKNEGGAYYLNALPGEESEGWIVDASFIGEATVPAKPTHHP